MGAKSAGGGRNLLLHQGSLRQVQVGLPILPFKLHQLVFKLAHPLSQGKPPKAVRSAKVAGPNA